MWRLGDGCSVSVGVGGGGDGSGDVSSSGGTDMRGRFAEVGSNGMTELTTK